LPAYTTSDMTRELRQSEIITGLVQFTYDPIADEAIATPHPYAIVLSQDCDLLRDYEDRNGGRPTTLNGILVYELEPVAEIRSKLSGGDILRRIKRHSEERYHLLEPVSAELDLLGLGLPELVIDFRRCYTMPPGEIYRQCMLDTAEGAKRRCRLETPYREHLQSRAAFYLQRVALPG
jgi:hypothetical protein